MQYPLTSGDLCMTIDLYQVKVLKKGEGVKGVKPDFPFVKMEVTIDLYDL